MNFENCPCKRIKCERRGDCQACRAYHAAIKGSPVFCERPKVGSARNGERAKRSKRAENG